MAFVFGHRSHALLLTVRPELQKLAIAALARSKIDFGVVQGNRTPEQQQQLYGHGRTVDECLRAGVPAECAAPGLPKVTWTLRSNHIGGNAIDVCPYVNGVYDWDNSGKKGFWPLIHTAFHEASQTLGIPVYWGGHFAKTPDRPHFSLVPG